MKFYSFDGKSFKEGLPVQVMISLIEESNVKYLDELSFNTVINWSAISYNEDDKDFGGVAIISKSNGGEEVIAVKKGEKKSLKLSKDDVMNIKTNEGEVFTIKAGNDEVVISKGKDVPSLKSDIQDGDSDEIIAVKKWLQSGNLGISSKTMANVFYSIPHMNKADYDAPYDPSDFKRCVDFLNAIPGSREKIDSLSSIKQWKNIVPVWDELEELYNQELNNKDGRMPLLYDKLSSLRKPQSSFKFK